MRELENHTKAELIEMVRSTSDLEAVALGQVYDALMRYTDSTTGQAYEPQHRPNPHNPRSPLSTRYTDRRDGVKRILLSAADRFGVTL